jgi:hypothetical protein
MGVSQRTAWHGKALPRDLPAFAYDYAYACAYAYGMESWTDQVCLHSSPRSLQHRQGQLHIQEGLQAKVHHHRFKQVAARRREAHT